MIRSEMQTWLLQCKCLATLGDRTIFTDVLYLHNTHLWYIYA